MRQTLNILACFSIAIAMLAGTTVISISVRSNSIENAAVTPYLKSPFWRFRLGYRDIFAKQFL